MNKERFLGHFAFDVFWSDEDSAWIAALTEPTNWHLSGIGESPGDAVQELAFVIDIALDDEE